MVVDTSRMQLCGVRMRVFTSDGCNFLRACEMTSSTEGEGGGRGV